LSFGKWADPGFVGSAHLPKRSGRGDTLLSWNFAVAYAITRMFSVTWLYKFLRTPGNFSKKRFSLLALVLHHLGPFCNYWSLLAPLSPLPLLDDDYNNFTDDK